MEKCSAVIACAALGMQFCAAMTSIQGTWTMLTVLFTDCGIMFLIGGRLPVLMTHLCQLLSPLMPTHAIECGFSALGLG